MRNRVRFALALPLLGSGCNTSSATEAGHDSISASPAPAESGPPAAGVSLFENVLVFDG